MSRLYAQRHMRRYFSESVLEKRREKLRAGPGLSDFMGSSTPLTRPQAFWKKVTIAKNDRDMINLQDRFGRVHNYLRISLTERCNFRCTYCMPADGVMLSPESNLLASEEILRLAYIFAQMGTTKVRLTGGEPTLRKDLAYLCQQIKALNGIDSVGLTTNGVLLTKLLDQLLLAGVSTINVSLDSVNPTTFSTMTRRPPQTLDKVLDGISAASLSPIKVKLNCVVMRDQNEKQLPHLIEFFMNHSHRFPHLDLRFIEWMPFNANEWKSKTLVPADEMIQIIQSTGTHRLQSLQATDPNDTTRWFRIKDAPAQVGRIGFISSMTQHFCGGCNRVRLTSDGALKTCLFGNDAVSLRDLMRRGVSDIELAEAIHAALQLKHFKHNGHDDGALALAQHSDENRPMVRIGG